MISEFRKVNMTRNTSFALDGFNLMRPNNISIQAKMETIWNAAAVNNVQKKFAILLESVAFCGRTDHPNGMKSVPIAI